jgi:hypothetical protein
MVDVVEQADGDAAPRCAFDRPAHDHLRLRADVEVIEREVEASLCVVQERRDLFCDRNRRLASVRERAC